MKFNFVTRFVFFIFCICSVFSCASKSNVDNLSSGQNSETVFAEQLNEDIFVFENISDVKQKVDNKYSSGISFTEVWGYLLDGREKEILPAINSVTDIGYFGAGLNTFGKLVGVPNPNKLKKTISNAKQKFKGNIHLVIVDNSRSLTHFCLNPEFRIRKELIDDIVKGAKSFDGVQIDFELVSNQDEEHYLSFLKELKKRLPNKILSVAIPARTKTLEKDAYHYEKINQIVDKIIVMAYDEHWATSKPGPVASIKWCKNVMNYALSVLPAEKLVMGLPFYGRGWNTDDTAGAYRYPTIEKLQNSHQISQILRENDIPSFEITKEVTYKFYYDDLLSLTTRMDMYKSSGVQNIGFWRVGQEGTDIWNYVKVEDKR